MLPYYAVNRWIVVLRAKVAPLLDCTYDAKKREFELPIFRGVIFGTAVCHPERIGVITWGALEAYPCLSMTT